MFRGSPLRIVIIVFILLLTLMVPMPAYSILPSAFFTTQSIDGKENIGTITLCTGSWFFIGNEPQNQYTNTCATFTPPVYVVGWPDNATANPPSNYIFDHWELDGRSYSNENPITVWGSDAPPPHWKAVFRLQEAGGRYLVGEVKFTGTVIDVDVNPARDPAVIWIVKVDEVFNGEIKVDDVLPVWVVPFGGSSPREVDYDVIPGDKVEVYGYLTIGVNGASVEITESRHYFRKIEPSVRFRGKVVVVFEPDYAVNIEEVLEDPTGRLKTGDGTLNTVYGQGQVIGRIQVGSYVEVYGEIGGTWTAIGEYRPPTGIIHQIWIHKSNHYIKLIGQELSIDVWTDKGGQGRGNLNGGQYTVGETVNLYCSLNTNVDRMRLVVIRPDGSEVVVFDGARDAGTHSFSGTAEQPTGEKRVICEAWKDGQHLRDEVRFTVRDKLITLTEYQWEDAIPTTLEKILEFFKLKTISMKGTFMAFLDPADSISTAQLHIEAIYLECSLESKPKSETITFNMVKKGGGFAADVELSTWWPVGAIEWIIALILRDPKAILEQLASEAIRLGPDFIICLGTEKLYTSARVVKVSGQTVDGSSFEIALDIKLRTTLEQLQEEAEKETYLYTVILSPLALSVVDEMGRRTGFYEGKELNEIPNSVYLGSPGKLQLVIVLSPRTSYRIELEFMGEGNYTLIVGRSVKGAVAEQLVVKGERTRVGSKEVYEVTVEPKGIVVVQQVSDATTTTTMMTTTTPVITTVTFTTSPTYYTTYVPQTIYTQPDNRQTQLQFLQYIAAISVSAAIAVVVLGILTRRIRRRKPRIVSTSY
ncbi:MAG: hypothetical protein QXO76_03670 [Thermoproteota archaeon]